MTETKNEAKARRARARRDAAKGVMPSPTTIAPHVMASNASIAFVPVQDVSMMPATTRIKNTHDYITLTIKWNAITRANLTWSHSGNKITFSSDIHPKIAKALMIASHLPREGWVMIDWIRHMAKIAETSKNAEHLLSLMAQNAMENAA